MICYGRQRNITPKTMRIPTPPSVPAPVVLKGDYRPRVSLWVLELWVLWRQLQLWIRDWTGAVDNHSPHGLESWGKFLAESISVLSNSKPASTCITTSRKDCGSWWGYTNRDPNFSWFRAEWPMMTSRLPWCKLFLSRYLFSTIFNHTY